MNQNELKSRTLSSFLWKALEKLGTQGVQFVISVMLARLLAPDDYGVFSVVAVFTTFSLVFVERGFGYALIQKIEADKTDTNTVFLLNLALSFLLYLILFFAAPFIANWYENQAYVLILRVLAIILILGGINNTLASIVARELDFKKQFVASMAAIVLSGTVGIVMAFKGFGAWSFVAQQLTSRAVTCVILWGLTKYKPSTAFSVKSAKRMFSFSWKLTVVGMIATAKSSIRTLIIGKVYSTNDLAYYEKARTIPVNFETVINYTLQTVSLSVLSKAQNDLVRLKSMLRRMVRTCSYILIPTMFGLAACSYNIICVLLTDKWAPAAPYMQIICFSLIFASLSSFSLNALNAIGRSDVNLKRNIIQLAVDILLLLISVKISLYAIAFSMIISSLIGFSINLVPLRKYLGYKFREQVTDVIPPILLSAAMYGIIYLTGFINIAKLPLLFVQIAAGVVSYIILSAIFRIEAFSYILSTAKNLLKNRKNNSGKAINK